MDGFGALAALVACVVSGILFVIHDYGPALGVLGIAVVCFAAERYVR